MAWTKTPPTETGYYWWRATPDIEPVIVRVYPFGTDRLASANFDGSGWCDVNYREGEWWSDPIRPPVEPCPRGWFSELPEAVIFDCGSLEVPEFIRNHRRAKEEANDPEG